MDAAGEFSRTELLLGPDAMARLAAARVAVFGIGGVGSYAVEALARSGIGAFVLVDHDAVDITNINRQIIALHSTIGHPKVEVARRRILDIHPGARVETHREFCDASNLDRLLELAAPDGGPPGAPPAGARPFDYVVDAIDSVGPKIELIARASAAGIPIISSMGAGNKLDPTRLELADIYGTSVCPLARVMRSALRARGVARLDVVYSRETPIARSRPPGSVSFVPSAAGLIIASHIVRAIACQTPAGMHSAGCPV